MKRIVKWKNQNNTVAYTGKVYYLNTLSGSDSNNGLSTTQAWKTSSYAETQMVNGDVLLTKTDGDGGRAVMPSASKSEYFKYKINDTIVTPSVEYTMLDAISQFGITWIFDKEYPCGQFATGDWWVVGPVSIISITPPSTINGGRTINGSMINPKVAMTQGYDSACSYSTYSASVNVALNVSPSNPLILQNGSSLVSTISVAAAGSRPQLQTAAILTVLESAPLTGSFRPPYSGTDKTIKYNVSQLNSNYNLLNNLAPVANTPSLATVERYFERPWIDHIPNFASRFIHPADNMPDYGREMSRNIGIGAVMLHLDYTAEQKKTLLIRFIQLGIDLYGVAQEGIGTEWPGGGGGNGSGRKWPILFAGLMLNDTGMKNIGQRSGDYLYSGSYGPGNMPPDYIQFGEDTQVFYVTADDVTRTNSSSWNPDERNGDGVPYSSADIGLPEWGIHHATDPYQDNKDWDAIYRLCCSSIAWSGIVLAARIMNANTPTLWNNPALFDYQDRYMAVMATASITPDWRYNVSGFITNVWASHADLDWRQNSPFVEKMWDEYRDIY